MLTRRALARSTTSGSQLRALHTRMAVERAMQRCSGSLNPPAGSECSYWHQASPHHGYLLPTAEHKREMFSLLALDFNTKESDPIQVKAHYIMSSMWLNADSIRDGLKS